MKFDIITIFPGIFDSYFNESILGRAKKNGLIDIKIHDLRNWTFNNHKTVDDTPYGGGAGMIMKIEPIYLALKDLDALKNANKKSRTILFHAGGKQLIESKTKEYANLERLVLVCGRYEGIDERVLDYCVDEVVSLGPYVLTGGEIPAMAVVDAVSRHIKGVLGNEESSEDESFNDDKSIEYPQYTRPEEFESHDGKIWRVPDILLSGNHEKIKKWRESQKKPYN